jgi:hypothetical protein
LEVLTPANTIAIYGACGKNGVVKITLKKPPAGKKIESAAMTENITTIGTVDDSPESGVGE